jgi:hypothetical protein
MNNTKHNNTLYSFKNSNTCSAIGTKLLLLSQATATALLLCRKTRLGGVRAQGSSSSSRLRNAHASSYAYVRQQPTATPCA